MPKHFYPFVVKALCFRAEENVKLRIAHRSEDLHIVIRWMVSNPNHPLKTVGLSQHLQGVHTVSTCFNPILLVVDFPQDLRRFSP